MLAVRQAELLNVCWVLWGDVESLGRGTLTHLGLTHTESSQSCSLLAAPGAQHGWRHQLSTAPSGRECSPRRDPSARLPQCNCFSFFGRSRWSSQASLSRFQFYSTFSRVSICSGHTEATAGPERAVPATHNAWCKYPFPSLRRTAGPSCSQPSTLSFP